jgi:CheY-like chemotaxis protein
MELSHDNDNSILLVDDEPDIATVLKQSLEKLGFQVFAFTDPLVALEHFQIDSKEYGLVMSDLRMPAMNGYEFVKKSRK